MSDTIESAEQWGQRLQENNEDLALAYEELDLLDKQIAKLKRGRLAGPISFSIAGVGTGLFAGELMRPDTNVQRAGIYGGVALGSVGVWLLGYFFGWW